MNPGDLSWDSFSKYADITVFERTPQELAVEHIGNSDAILLNKVKITSDILSKCTNLKYIGVFATGYNVIDVDAVKKREYAQLSFQITALMLLHSTFSP